MIIPFPHTEGKLLSTLCTFGIGGPAKYFADCTSCEQMAQMIAFCHTHNLPYFILGKGSNTLFDDRGFNGLVIHNRIDTLKIEGNIVTAGSGYGFARLGGQTARLGMSGLEFASGIPATVGGAIYMNAGANGKETKDALQSVLYVKENGEIVSYRKEELEFSYRTSSFQKWKGAIVEGVFALTPCVEAKDVQKEILDYRLKTQPYKDKSAGCAFRNPQGGAAGKLIDECGGKGMLVGGAGVSEKHANFIINKGGAKASDILALIAEIKEKVLKERGIHLEEEIRYVPYND